MSSPSPRSIRRREPAPLNSHIPVEMLSRFIKPANDPVTDWYERSTFPGTWNTSCPSCSATIPRHLKACSKHV